MRFYIASRLENAANVKKLKHRLESYGHTHTYDWTTHGAVRHLGSKVMGDVAQKEMAGVLEADLVVALLPGGRGTHVEIGMAMACGMPVLMHSPDPTLFGTDEHTCAFYHHDFISRLSGPHTMDELGLFVHERWGHL